MDLSQSQLLQIRHIRVLRNPVISTHQDRRLIQPGMKVAYTEAPLFDASTTIDSTMQFRRVTGLIVPPVVFPCSQGMIACLVT